MLQGRKKGERRLRALIEIGTADLQSIKGSAGFGVPHDDRSVIVTKKPIRGGGDAVRPPSVAVDGLGAGTRIGEGRHLNGLLVESRTMVIGAAASDGSDREMPLRGSRSSSHSRRSNPRLTRIGRSSADPAAIIASGRVALA